MKIGTAKHNEHDKCCKVMKLYPYTKDFSHMFYSSKERYDKGDIMVAREGKKIIGVACVSYRNRRYKGRKPAANVQFIAVALRGLGIGTDLMKAIQDEAPEGRIELKVEETNKKAVKAYRAMGFKRVSKEPSTKPGIEYLVMVKEKTPK